ncbi:uncharacterized protein [Periplaneta americana]|uniref:uncharacterized protein isoform X2 n=1 Tax=Periplaneta americana TaxID=6978 RepID=UPI0037E835DA
MARQISINSLMSLSGCLETIARRNKVNPAEPRVDINDGKWEAKDATLPRQQSVCSPTPEDHDASVDSIAVSEEPPPDLPGNPCTRKSSKAKRVKNYLKKCKDAALGNSNAAQNEDKEQSAEPAADQEGPEPARLRTSRRRSNSGSREVSTTSWYIASTLEPSTNLVSVVEVLPPESAGVEVTCDSSNSTVIEITGESVVPEEAKVCAVTRESLDGPGEVLDSRNEGGTTLIVIESREENPPCSAVIDEFVDSASEQFPPSENSMDTAFVTPETTETKCDVASLVERHLGTLYPNFPRVRPVLVRQARDLLVCTFHGNLVRFEREFCVPAAELLQAVRGIADRKVSLVTMLLPTRTVVMNPGIRGC